MTRLCFDFNNQAIEFTQPIKVISCTQLKEVNSCLQEIEKYLQQGYYAAGYLAYEAGYALIKGLSNEFLEEQQLILNQQANKKEAIYLPLVWFGIFTQPKKAKKIHQQEFKLSEWQLTKDFTAYQQEFNQLFAAIKNKELTSANLTQQLTADFSGCAFSYYQHLRQAQQANYSAYWQVDDKAIISVSPELFFQQKGADIFVKPMKGTSPRGKSSLEDELLAKELRTSSKNQLENRLAVEAMQQELAPLLLAGQEPEISWFELASYPSVWQMTSSFTAKLKEQITPLDTLRQLFPCTSIAGTPKTAAVEALAKVEQIPRGIYCGSLGYFTPDKEAIFNVAIRTLSVGLTQGKAVYGAGGALTHQATAEEEFAELLTKTQVLHLQPQTFELLETLRLEEGKLLLLDEHLERLIASANYFNYPLNIKQLKQQLYKLESCLPNNSWRVRLTLAAQGYFKLTCVSIIESFYWPSRLKELSPSKDSQEPKKVVCQLAQQPMDKNNPLHFHKTTARDIYTCHQAQQLDVFDTLLFNDKEEVTEFTLGNLLVEINGVLYTPVLASGLLAGTLRQYLLNLNIIQEKTISLAEVTQAEKIWFINSVRGWLEVELLK